MEEGSRSVTWYATATDENPSPFHQVTSKVVSRLIRLRLGVPMASQILQTARPMPVLLRNEDDPLHHYPPPMPSDPGPPHHVAWIPDTETKQRH
ncbi:hypothetical protein GWK47_049936 [Chionoecetes opilio]|uniref:Uncharacterized protein n=1 Tax=Chionoecetes opilio TaxID=41210 RepID=A0A8J4Y1Y5_CHIOP|nr:hypothetical protein GWK47_049936 [Chionoecetes opilio]